MISPPTFTVTCDRCGFTAYYVYDVEKPLFYLMLQDGWKNDNKLARQLCPSCVNTENEDD